MNDLGLLGIEDPRTLGLLSLGLRLMSTPGRFGPALGTAGMGALGDVLPAIQQQRMNQRMAAQDKRQEARDKMAEEEFAMRLAQLEEAQRTIQERRNYLASVGGAMGPAEPINPAVALSRGLSPQDLAMLVGSKEKRGPVVIGPGGMLVDPESGKTIASAPFKPESPSINDLVMIGPDGKPMINQALLDAKKQIAEAGRSPGVSVSYGAPVSGISPVTNEPELFRPDNRGGMKGTGIKPMPGTDQKLTEGEAKATTFLSQMASAERELSGVPLDQTKLWSQVETGLAQGATNLVTGQAAQRARQAQEQWSEAYLRFKTGAATTADEISRNIRTFFPQPGDKPEQVAQKTRARAQAVQDMKIAAGRGAAKVDATIPPIADSAAPKRIATEAEYEALPSGSMFVGPDGKKRRKP